jgi:Flp pilus assembly protein protease CpaA
MIEEVLFGQLTMPGEIFRVILAFAGVIIAAYFDLFNNKNVPDMFLFGFLAVAFLANLIFYDENLFPFSLAIAIFVSAIGFLFYRVGQLGGADVFILASIMLLLPIHPEFVELSFNLPFIFSVWVFSGVLFALYVMVYFGYKLMQNDAKPNLAYALLFIPYLLFAWFYVNSFLFSAAYFIFLTVAILATIFFLMYRKSLLMIMAEELPVTQLEPEDVLALEIMNKDMVQRYKIPRLVTTEEIERLKTDKVPDVWIYTKLPPFVPFILGGMILSLLFAQHLLLI